MPNSTAVDTVRLQRNRERSKNMWTIDMDKTCGQQVSGAAAGRYRQQLKRELDGDDTGTTKHKHF